MNIAAVVDYNRKDSLPIGTDTLAPVLESSTVILTFEERYRPCSFGAKFLYMSNAIGYS